MNRNLLLEISLNDTKSSSCVAIDSARPRPEQEVWHHPRWFGTQSCRVVICLCSITLGFCKPPPQSPFGDGRWVIDFNKILHLALKLYTLILRLKLTNTSSQRTHDLRLTPLRSELAVQENRDSNDGKSPSSVRVRAVDSAHSPKHIVEVSRFSLTSLSLP